MGYPRAQRFLALCAILLLAACGSATPTATVTAVAPHSAPTPQAVLAVPVLAATATPQAADVRPTATSGAAPSPTTPPTATSPVSAAPQPTATQRPSPTTALPSWVQVAHWQGDTLIVTEAFTVRGPWRICWSLPGGEVFQLMVGDVRAGTWELLTAQEGATMGRFDQAHGGNYQLMFHNDTPYVVVVEDTPPGGLPPSRSIQPCTLR